MLFDILFEPEGTKSQVDLWRSFQVWIEGVKINVHQAFVLFVIIAFALLWYLQILVKWSYEVSQGSLHT